MASNITQDVYVFLHDNLYIFVGSTGHLKADHVASSKVNASNLRNIKQFWIVYWSHCRLEENIHHVEGAINIVLLFVTEFPVFESLQKDQTF